MLLTDGPVFGSRQLQKHCVGYFLLTITAGKAQNITSFQSSLFRLCSSNNFVDDGTPLWSFFDLKKM
jgi:hypothetical protein